MHAKRQHSHSSRRRRKMMKTVLIAVTGLLLWGSVAQGVVPTVLQVNLDNEAAKEVKFDLYTNEHPNDAEVVKVTELPQSFERFNATRPTIIIVHGWRGKKHQDKMLPIKDALLSKVEANVIMFNWCIVDTLVYPLAVWRVPVVAKQGAAIVKHLVDHQKLDPRRLHFVGYSLGAHVAGLAAQELRTKMDITVGRITGLDPAGPMYGGTDQDFRLDSSQADFVDVIHTCYNALGLNNAVGHVNFYPNGGTCSQPGCMALDLLKGSCSHSRSVAYFLESILKKNSFLALPGLDGGKPCESVDEDGTPIDMGFYVPTSARGAYCLATRSEEPFGYGTTVLSPWSLMLDAAKRSLIWALFSSD